MSLCTCTATYTLFGYVLAILTAWILTAWIDKTIYFLSSCRCDLERDRRSEPRHGERVPYVIVYGTPGQALIQLVRKPRDVMEQPGLRLNATYYITKLLIPPLDRAFSLMGVDVREW